MASVRFPFGAQAGQPQRYMVSCTHCTVPREALLISVTHSVGALQALWNAYVQAMRQAGFSRDTPMYVASGLLTYGASDGALTPPLPALADIIVPIVHCRP